MNEINIAEEALLGSRIISSPDEEIVLHRLGRSVFALSESATSKLIFAFASSVLAAYLDSEQAQEIIRPFLIRKEQDGHGCIKLALQLKLEDGSIALLTEHGSLFHTHRVEIDGCVRSDQPQSPSQIWNLSNEGDLKRMLVTDRIAHIIDDLSLSANEVEHRLQILWKEFLIYEEQMESFEPKVIVGEFMTFIARLGRNKTVIFDSTH